MDSSDPPRHTVLHEIVHSVPVAMWAVDFTGFYTRIGEIVRSGQEDWSTFFAEHPAQAGELLSGARIVSVNDRAVRLHGAQDLAHLIGPIAAVIDADSIPALEQMMVRAAGGETELRAEVYLCATDGARRYVELRVALRPDSAGRCPGLATIIDRTRRHELASAVDRLSQELEQSRREVEQFAYTASHDMQEPLRAVISYCQLLSKRYAGNLDERADRYIHHISVGVRRMQALVADLLEFSRVGTRDAAFREVDCGQLLGRVLRENADSIEESGAQIVRHDLPTVMADPRGLSLVLHKLIDNAIKFRRDVPPEVRVTARRDGDDWIFAVADNGIGIPSEHLEAVFEVCRRLHPRELYPGTGLGLTIARKVVQRHGGRMWAESTPGHGSAFYFTLPAES